VDRWASFDCYGTLVDWRGGIGAGLERLFGAGRRDALLERYHALEPGLQADGTLSYRTVLARTLAAVAAEAGLEVPEGEEDVLARSLPGWPVFPDVREPLVRARDGGWRLAILSNTDRDLIESSIAAIGVPFDAVVVASEIGSYKPSHRHWHAFRELTGECVHVHVAQSLFHDIAPCRELGIRSIWVNRLGEPPGPEPSRALPDLERLPETLDELAGE
jgi:2-haloacid dehalogenase